MGKKKAQTRPVDSDYSGRPIPSVTIEGILEDIAKNGEPLREDRLIVVGGDGTKRDAHTGEQLPPAEDSS